MRVPVSSLAEHAESRQLMDRIAVPLDLLHRAAPDFTDEKSLPAAIFVDQVAKQ